MIYELLKEKNLADILTVNGGQGGRPQGSPLLPAYENREAWGSLPEDAKQHFTDKAEKIKDKEIAVLPASYYMEYARNGNRSVYERVYFKRREDLMTLTVAECISAKGEYIDAVMNLVWAICEETSWVIPAHDNSGGELPDIEREEIYIDLFAAETGAAISWAYYFLGDVFAKNAPVLKRRMEFEVDRRIISPYLKYTHFWYMGLENEDAFVNNWNPWINSNVIVALAVFEKNRERLIQGIEKTAKSIDVFIKSYHADGACDEGPSYFGLAGASLFDYLEVLNVMTGGAVNIYGNELIKNIARYIYRVYIGGEYFVNFADSPPRPGVSAKLLARIGEAVGDDNLIGFANMMRNNNKRGAYSVGASTIYRNIKSLLQDECKYKGFAFAPPKSHWFDGNEILTARDKEGSTEGIFIAAKGGHNAESHNHNDIGNFILYSDGKPVVIDAGVETYTKKTFSSERYDIWTMQSGYHNLPVINGFEQTDGKDRRASDVKYECNGDGIISLSMQLKGAYPEEAGIESYTREFVFEPGKSFVVRDRYSLSKCKAPYALNLLCASKPEIEKDGECIYLGENIEMRLEGANFCAGNTEIDIRIEEIELSDATLKNGWQRDCLYRLVLTEKEMKKENDIKICFSASNEK